MKVRRDLPGTGIAITAARASRRAQLRAEVSQNADFRPAKLALRQMTFIRLAGSTFWRRPRFVHNRGARKLAAQALQGEVRRLPATNGRDMLRMRNMPVHVEQFRWRQVRCR